MPNRKLMLPLLGLVFTAGTCFAQAAAEPGKFYKLEFTVKEVEGGKTINSRSYSTILQSQMGGGPSAMIRTGSRVPTSNSSGGVQYLDVGVNIDCRDLRETGTEVTLFVNADLSSPAQEQGMPAPVIRQNRWSSTVIAPVKKPTVIFASDDATSKRQIQLELTATPVAR